MFAFSTGLIVGRFQTFHRGHEEMIRCALDVCDTILLFIGSSQESGTQKNPFTYQMRHDVIAKVFKREICAKRLFIHPLPDAGLGNNTAWGEYVLRTAHEYGFNPQIMISGKETRRETWFNDDLFELFIPKTENISATMLRLAMLRDDREMWKRYVPQRTWDMYDQLRPLLIAAQENAETASI